jgi:DUF971 family protein
MSERPSNLQVVGDTLAIAWSDGTESYIPVKHLRARSPSAEVLGERDIFGQKYGGAAGTGTPDVSVLGWEWVGSYAVRFEFSDGHRTGLYAYGYLKTLADEVS